MQLFRDWARRAAGNEAIPIGTTQKPILTNSNSARILMPFVCSHSSEMTTTAGHVPTNGYHYQGAPGATGRQARARSLAEHAAENTAEEANDRCRTPDDSTAEEKHSDHNRTNLAPRQAPAWAPFTFQGLSCELSHAAHGRFVEARPARPTSTRLRSHRTRQSPSGGSIVAQTKRNTVPRGVPARCRAERLEEPWRTRRNAPRPRATGAATSG